MAKSNKVQIKQLTAEEATIPVSDISETERIELAAISVVNDDDETTRSGEMDNRLPYPPRTREGQEAFLELGKSIPPYLWIARARALGHSLTADEVREIIAYDGPEVTCAAPSGLCMYRFKPIRMAFINPGNGLLGTDERLLSASNPRCVVYRGAYLVVPADPSIRYSAKKILGPLCQRDQHSLTASYKDAGWPVRSFGLAEAEAFVASENSKQNAARRTYLDNKNANARAAGLLTEDGKRVERGGGQFRNNPHQNSGRQNFRLGDIVRVSHQK